jgi:hypothetical protein
MFASAAVLGKYTVGYFRCSRCGFIRTEEPYWLEEAYSSAITGSDVGLVRRNFQLAAIAKVVIATFFGRAGYFVDYAGGYGLFVRLMRDSGFDFRWYDKYCNNLFARDFVAPQPVTEPAELLTAFEVFEHLADPFGELERMLTFSPNILFTTQLLPEPAPRPGEWWYYGLEHGQHIAFYTREALLQLAKRAGLNYYTNGASMHLFTEKRLLQPLFFGLARYRTARFLAPFVGRKSLVSADYAAAAGSVLDRGK